MGAICQCEKKFIKRGPREREGENHIGPRKTIKSEWATRCFPNYSNLLVKVEKKDGICAAAAPAMGMLSQSHVTGVVPRFAKKKSSDLIDTISSFIISAAYGLREMGKPISFTFYVRSKSLGHVHDTSLSVYHVTTSQYDQTSVVLVPFSSTLLFS